MPSPLSLLVSLPAIGALICLCVRSPRQALVVASAAVASETLAGAWVIAEVAFGGPQFGASSFFHVDALSAYHLLIMLIVFGLSTLYAWSYFHEEWNAGRFSTPQARQFGALWLAAMEAMVFVLVSNNLGVMWVGLDATTLLTAFLISLHVSASSLEAMWKYILICSVGLALAFMGTLLMAASAADLPAAAGDFLLWTQLRQSAESLDPSLVKAAFIFLLVGYGTKAGLAPMHNWLPDAHSQAPAPISALFSGFMLNAAFYCILRYLPIVETATGHSGWAPGLLRTIGLISIALAAAFVAFQQDLKRLLAYSSVEHLGIMALGTGLGPAGSFAALLHMLNHSLGKSLAFFSAGSLGQAASSHRLEDLTGALRLHRAWGLGIVAGLLTLVGVAPFGIFISEFYLLRAAIEQGRVWVVVIFLVGTAIIFVRVMAAVVPLAWGRPAADREIQPSSPLGMALVLVPVCALLLLGLLLPTPLGNAIRAAADVIGAIQWNVHAADVPAGM